MDKSTRTPSVGKLSLEDEDVEDLFASPESGATTQKHTPSSQASSAHKYGSVRPSSRSRQRQDESEAEARDARLRAELEKVREVNKVIEGVTASLSKAKENMETVNRTVNSASTLLATWTRILSQSEHNQRLILNPNWHGASQDLEDMENEDLRRQQETERRAAEEQRRREEAQRRAEDEERRKALAASTPGKGGSKTRGTRGGSSSTRGGYPGVGGQAGRARGGTAGARGGNTTESGIARSGSTRGRGRGLG